MPEQNKPFVVTDRRKFAMDGTPRPDADPSPERDSREAEPAAVSAPPPEPTKPQAQAEAAPTPEQTSGDDLPPPPTAREMEQVNDAYQQTSERLETAVRAANPGMERPPEMNFEQIVHSIYMTTIIQLGGVTKEGEQPRVDLMGARQSIDMLSILAEKTKGNLTPEESRLLDNALFELRMGFLEITQALARSAANRPQGPGAPPVPGAPVGPKIVR
ncbi:MAG TPA: DUF1844 domain-containing protein [Acidobacteriaceae bacterium]|nr:DUF1844 domain-containing protein [Acidobacteriaceae bacterium]